MDKQSPESRSKSYRNFRSSLHIGMGIVYLMLGGLAVGMKAFGHFTLEPAMAYLLGGLLFLYGLFRLWRGFQELRIRKAERTEQ